MMSHGIAEIPHQMVRWDYDQGKVDPGLLARRVKEVNMYLTPVA
jgi:GH24 family phage-related lysozyme (muramidase)